VNLKEIITALKMAHKKLNERNASRDDIPGLWFTLQPFILTIGAF